MIARDRGDLRLHSRWRPGGPQPAARPSADERRQRRNRIHRAWLLIPIAVFAITVGLALALTRSTGSRAQLPATPREWVNAWAAAAVDNPGRVCHTLYSPALAAVYTPATGRTCLAYFANTNSTSFRIRRVLVDGNAASVEARQTGQRPHWGYFTMLLSHVADGWQAIDLVPGAPIR